MTATWLRIWLVELAYDLLDLAPPEEAEETSQDGNRDFEEVFRSYYPTMVRYFARRGVAEGDREDLAQETFLRIYNHLETYSGRGSFEGWLFRIASNIHRNKIRDGKAKKRRTEDSLESFLQDCLEPSALEGFLGQTPRLDPLAHTLEREGVGVLARGLLELPDRMRRCFFLRVHHELKYQEIADLMSISIETVKAHLYQARNRLQKDLAPYLDEGKGKPRAPGKT